MNSEIFLLTTATLMIIGFRIKYFLTFSLFSLAVDSFLFLVFLSIATLMIAPLLLPTSMILSSTPLFFFFTVIYNSFKKANFEFNTHDEIYAITTLSLFLTTLIFIF